MPLPIFIENLRTGLAYWQMRTADESEANISRLDEERHNLHRFMTYIEKIPELWADTAVVTLQAFYLVERRGYWHEWIPFMEQAVTKWVVDNPLLKAKILNRLGYLYQKERQMHKAIATHEKAAALAEEIGDDFVLHQAYFYLCAGYRQKLDFERAEQYGQKALDGFSKNNEVNKWWAFVLNDLGIVAMNLGQYSLARERLEASIELLRQMDLPTDMLRTISNLLGLAREEKNPEMALHYYYEAQTLLEDISSESDKVQLELHLGGIYYDLEKYSEAEVVFRRANSFYLQQSSNIYMQALVLQCLGISQLKQMKLRQAEESLQESIRLWRRADDKIMLGNSLGTLAECFEAQEDNETAYDLYNEALAMFADFPDVAMAQRLTKEYKKYIKRLEEQNNRRLL